MQLLHCTLSSYCEINGLNWIRLYAKLSITRRLTDYNILDLDGFCIFNLTKIGSNLRNPRKCLGVSHAFEQWSYEITYVFSAWSLNYFNSQRRIQLQLWNFQISTYIQIMMS